MRAGPSQIDHRAPYPWRARRLPVRGPAPLSAQSQGQPPPRTPPGLSSLDGMSCHRIINSLQKGYISIETAETHRALLCAPTQLTRLERNIATPLTGDTTAPRTRSGSRMLIAVVNLLHTQPRWSLVSREDRRRPASTHMLQPTTTASSRLQPQRADRVARAGMRLALSA